MRIGTKIFKIFILCWFSSKVTAVQEKIFCGRQFNLDVKVCEIRDVNSISQLQFVFYILHGLSHRYIGRYGWIDNDMISYSNELEFVNSSFTVFPTHSFRDFSHVKVIKAQNVGLTQLHQYHLKLFKGLETLDLSLNRITILENYFIRHLESLVTLNLSHNQIEYFDEDAFVNCSKSLSTVDLAHNKIKNIYSRILVPLVANDKLSLHLDFNNIEEISFDDSSKHFKLLNLSHNSLTKFDFTCLNISQLILNDNFLKEFKMSKCFADQLDLRNNSLERIENINSKELFISDNNNLKNISMNYINLRKFYAANIQSKDIKFELLQNSSQLVELDATNTFLGTPKIETFSEMSLVEVLKLRNTGLSHIENGMFGHQVNVKNLDISYNNLGHIDIETLSSMKALNTLDISGNNLTYLNDVNDFKRNFPNLTLIGIENNNWNCSYLKKVVKVFYENSISIKQPANLVENSSNVMGIGCTTLINTIILLAIIMTVLAVIGVVFGYKKLKNLLYRRNETPNVLERSTNTMNTTVEFLLDDKEF